jgi:acyl-CoA reductase-like NAD-dependent aldehyde dehydrogenase
LTIIRVPDPEAAVAAANATRYGLAGGVWTKDMERAQDIARRIRAGYFWINTYGAVFGDLPFGGFAMSGLGREGGQYSYEAYTELKSVMIDTTGGSSAPLF